MQTDQYFLSGLDRRFGHGRSHHAAPRALHHVGRSIPGAGPLGLPPANIYQPLWGGKDFSCMR